MTDVSNAMRRLTNRPAVLLWLLCLVTLHAFFYQGGGWNQNARFDSVRALVEHGSFEITAFASNTGDVVQSSGKLFANKPPGQSLLAAPLYFILFQLERATGVSADDPRVANANAYFLTWFTSGLPASIVVVLLALALRRGGATRSEALLLASTFGVGSLVLPYAGVLMAHNLTACLLFGAWLSVTTPSEGIGRAALVGALLGWAVLTDFLAAPAALLLGAYAVWQRPCAREVVALMFGPAICAGILLFYNVSCFGRFFTTPYTTPSARFLNAGLWLGLFDWPQPMRLYWLTLHPFRGLFYCCPVFFIPLFSLLRRPRWRRIRSESLLAGAVVGSFLLFNLSFNGWTGGWGVGPRYLIPAMPFLFLAAPTGYRSLPIVSAALAFASTLFMLCVTSVTLMVPGPNEGAAPDLDPLRDTARVLASGHVSVNEQSIDEMYPARAGDDDWDSWNLGELLGLAGWCSLLPAGALVLALYGSACFPGHRKRWLSTDQRHEE